MQARPLVLTFGSFAQLLPHAPQLATSVPMMLTQLPAHSVVPTGHWHDPAWQVAPPLHAVHDAPQCIESVDASTQVPPQSVWPLGQAQTPAWHVSPPVHAWPQLPQLALSVCLLVQEAPQRSGLADVGHWHAPARQTWALAHALSHAPQWFGSVVRVAQVPLQTVSPAPQPLAHAYGPPSADAQSGVAPVHVTPHPPQLLMVDRFVPQPLPASAQSP